MENKCYNKSVKVKESQRQKGGDYEMGMSDRIESFILELLKEDDDWLEIGRNELASVFKCVPSQINYVIATRFNQDRGYIVESKRGGGGYLRIKRIPTDENPIYSAVMRIGKTIDFNTAKGIITYFCSVDLISEKEYKIILSAISDNAMASVEKNKDYVRASVFKNMLLALI